jgi:A/G-specific adenine glycosylase
MIRDRHGGTVPRSLELLKEINGIGDYAAGVVLTHCSGERVPLIDVNTERIITRAFLNGTLHVARKESIAMIKGAYMQALSSHVPHRFLCAMIELSHIHCMPSKPLCDSCPVRTKCLSATMLGQVTRNAGNI